MAEYPNDQFQDEIDELGYKLTREILSMQLIHKNPDLTKDNMRGLLAEFAKKKEETGYGKGMDDGISLGKLEQ